VSTINNYSPELQELLAALDKQTGLVAMLAPSFPVVFDYPQIVGKLHRLGFAYVIEVARGAAETNSQLLNELHQNPTKRFITSPCPTIYKLIETKYPHLKKYLSQADSPMIATAKLLKNKYPGFRPVFIGPCLMKKNEASQRHPELDILVLTYSEIQQVFEIKKIKNRRSDYLTGFDLIGFDTRLYSISGGLSQSAHLNESLTDDEYDVVSGAQMVNKSLEEFPNNKIRVLDILNCEGGCVAGPGIASPLTLEHRRQKIIAHWARAIKG